jgi:hypothetical protein
VLDLLHRYPQLRQGEVILVDFNLHFLQKVAKSAHRLGLTYAVGRSPGILH